MVKQDTIKFRNHTTQVGTFDIFFRETISNETPTVLNSNSVDYSITINGQPYNPDGSVLLGSSVAVTFNSIGSVKVFICSVPI